MVNKIKRKTFLKKISFKTNMCKRVISLALFVVIMLQIMPSSIVNASSELKNSNDQSESFSELIGLDLNAFDLSSNDNSSSTVENEKIRKLLTEQQKLIEQQIMGLEYSGVDDEDFDEQDDLGDITIPDFINKKGEDELTDENFLKESRNAAFNKLKEESKEQTNQIREDFVKEQNEAGDVRISEALVGLGKIEGQNEAETLEITDNRIPGENGVWVPKQYRKEIESLVNKASSQELYIDSTGFVRQKEGVQKDNTKSDTFALILDELINADQKIAIGIDDGWQGNDGEVSKRNLFEDEQKAVCIGDNLTSQIIIINSNTPQEGREIILAHELSHAVIGTKGLKSNENSIEEELAKKIEVYVADELKEETGSEDKNISKSKDIDTLKQPVNKSAKLTGQIYNFSEDPKLSITVNSRKETIAYPKGKSVNIKITSANCSDIKICIDKDGQRVNTLPSSGSTTINTVLGSGNFTIYAEVSSPMGSIKSNCVIAKEGIGARQYLKSIFPSKIEYVEVGRTYSADNKVKGVYEINGKVRVDINNLTYSADDNTYYATKEDIDAAIDQIQSTINLTVNNRYGEIAYGSNHKVKITLQVANCSIVNLVIKKQDSSSSIFTYEDKQSGEYELNDIILETGEYTIYAMGDNGSGKIAVSNIVTAKEGVSIRSYLKEAYNINGSDIDYVRMPWENPDNKISGVYKIDGWYTIYPSNSTFDGLVDRVNYATSKSIDEAMSGYGKTDNSVESIKYLQGRLRYMRFLMTPYGRQSSETGIDGNINNKYTITAIKALRQYYGKFGDESKDYLDKTGWARFKEILQNFNKLDTNAKNDERHKLQPIQYKLLTGLAIKSRLFLDYPMEIDYERYIHFGDSIVEGYPANPLVDPVLKMRLAALVRDKSPDSSKPVYIGSGYRNFQEQIDKYLGYGGVQDNTRFGIWSGNDMILASKPGRSWHMYGEAVDIYNKDSENATMSNWLREMEAEAATEKQSTLIQYGLFKPLTSGNGKTKLENWHIQPIETNTIKKAMSKTRLFSAFTVNADIPGSITAYVKEAKSNLQTLINKGLINSPAGGLVLDNIYDDAFQTAIDEFIDRYGFRVIYDAIGKNRTQAYSWIKLAAQGNLVEATWSLSKDSEKNIFDDIIVLKNKLVEQNTLSRAFITNYTNYDEVLKAEVLNFQKIKGLPATGVVDGATWRSLGLAWDYNKGRPDRKNEYYRGVITKGITMYKLDFLKAMNNDANDGDMWSQLVNTFSNSSDTDLIYSKFIDLLANNIMTSMSIENLGSNEALKKELYYLCRGKAEGYFNGFVGSIKGEWNDIKDLPGFLISISKTVSDIQVKKEQGKAILIAMVSEYISNKEFRDYINQNIRMLAEQCKEIWENRDEVIEGLDKFIDSSISAAKEYGLEALDSEAAKLLSLCEEKSGLSRADKGFMGYTAGYLIGNIEGYVSVQVLIDLALTATGVLVEAAIARNMLKYTKLLVKACKAKDFAELAKLLNAKQVLKLVKDMGSDAIKLVKNVADGFLKQIRCFVYELNDGIAFRPVIAGLGDLEDETFTVVNKADIQDLSKLRKIAKGENRFIDVKNIAPETAGSVKQIRKKGDMIELLDESGKVIISIPEAVAEATEAITSALKFAPETVFMKVKSITSNGDALKIVTTEGVELNLSEAKLISQLKTTQGMTDDVARAVVKCLKDGCFSGDTLISTNSGLKRIDSIKEGDYVLSKDVNSGTIDYKEVKKVYIKSTYEFVHLKLNEEEIRTTASHLFFTDSGWWKAAGNLKTGDRILNSKGEFRKLLLTSLETLQQPEKIYNLNVDEFHTYFVGTQGLLVHNDCTADMMAAGKKAIQDARDRGITDPDELARIGEEAADTAGLMFGRILKQLDLDEFTDVAYNHLKMPDGWSKRDGVSGGHNFKNFKKYFVDENKPMKIIKEDTHPNLPGLKEIYYKVGKGDGKGGYILGEWAATEYRKTVYTYLDEDIIKWAKEALKGKNIVEIIDNTGNVRGYKVSGSIKALTNNGLKDMYFEGWYDKSAGILKSFYPIMKE